MIKYSRIAVLLLLDAILVNLAYISAFLLRFEFDVNSNMFQGFFDVYATNILAITVINLLVFWFFGLYQSLWRYAGTGELIKVVAASFSAMAFTIVFLELIQQFFPRSIYIIDFVFTILFIGGMRLSYRTLREFRKPGAFQTMTKKGGRQALMPDGLASDGNLQKVMVFGAGDAGAAMIKEIKQHPEYGKKVVVVVDDDRNKLGSRIAGVKIAGDRSQIIPLAKKYGVDEIIISIPSAPTKTVQEIVNECNKTACKLKILPSLIDLINEKISISKLRDVDIEDLLGRDPVEVNLREISSYIEGKIILVTGGGGSIGSELCRQIARIRPRKLIALDIYENSVFELEHEIRGQHPDLEFDVVIASVRNLDRMREVFRKFKPHVVFHAAAHKHVPLMESNPKEAVYNNIFGTKNLVDLAEEFAVEKFVLISTDKAVNPTNVIGATKRVAEMILQEKSAHAKGTRYSAVRFGNVLGSNGSVIPIFRKQIEQGGPVTVTHPDITRYFMTIPEAVQLVIQAGAMANGGEIFILDMGQPVRIMDLAENVIRLSGFNPGVDIDIKITGLRPGEKLYEELLLNEEGIQETSHHKIFVGHPVPPSSLLEQYLKNEAGTNDDSTMVGEMTKSISQMNDQEVKSWLGQLVPNYTQDQNGTSKHEKI